MDRDRVDQTLYWWAESNLLGLRGVGPVASSFDTDSRMRAVDAELSSHVRTADAAGVTRPAWSMCYVRAAGWAAVVRRSRSDGEARHDVGHALVGHPDAVTPQLALSLADWPGWRTERDPERPPVLSARDLWADYESSRDRLDAEAGEVSATAAALLDARLEDPAAPIGLIIPPSVSPRQTVTVLWVVDRVLSLLLERSDAGDPHHHTFASYAPTLTDQANHRLRTVCAPGVLATGSYAVTRTVVRPFADGEAAPPMASALVERYAREGVRGLRKIATEYEIFALPELDSRLNRLAHALDGPVQGGAGLDRADLDEARPGAGAGAGAGGAASDSARQETGPIDPVRQEAGSAQPGRQPGPRRTGENQHTPVTEPGPTTPRRATTGQGDPPRAGTGWSSGPNPSRDSGLLNDLHRLATAPPFEIVHYAAELRRWNHQIKPWERASARDYLTRQKFFADRLHGNVPGAHMRVAVANLVAITVDTDPAAGADQWSFVGSPGMPAVVVQAACDHAYDNRAWPQLVPWLGLQTLRGNGYPLPADNDIWSPPPPGRLSSWSGLLRRLRRSRQLLWLLGTTLTTGTLLGFLIGRTLP